MPYVSEKQRKFFNANVEKFGKKVVKEWNKKSKASEKKGKKE